jgi:hypothetical protein
MAGVTLAEAEAALALWIAADAAVAKGQSYTIGDRSYTKADAGQITEKIMFWDRYIKRLTRGGIKVVFGTPC